MLTLHLTMHTVDDGPASLARAVSYECKMFMKWTTGQKTYGYH